MDAYTETLVSRLRAEASNAMRKHLSLGMHDLCVKAAAIIEAQAAKIAVLEADKEKLQADLDAHLEFIKSETPGAPKA